ncbi:translation initiation factor eIF-1A [Candidatus Woesearchaeota archaeon CG11_big_fil_rev_8_21_14_0_20_43_8]|nr:MAG: translation initiation factor eIF-1A [Candidatus Woesearchaeota archaeon CG11_big_fil_rev_8_21_14_0_20_43_8]PIO05316.1 MAG: translation initiation factor eIF-1A [Candidatus Woesearchaeota archaeon CG08_land_8_20_14_0_20_43_7]
MAFIPKKKKKVKKGQEAEEEDQLIRRVKLPRGRETLGLLDQRLGASRVRVRCLDGKTRVCRIPGRLKRRLWVRPGDIVIVEPWEFGGDEKGDVIFKYKPIQVQWLETNGYLKKLTDMDAF